MWQGRKSDKLQRILLLLCAALFLPGVQTGFAQELSPRAFWPSPVGTKAISLGYSYTSGDIVIDPDLPVEGLNADINTVALAYFQTFDLAGRTANYIMEFPLIWGTLGGVIDPSQYLPPDLPPDKVPDLPDSFDFDGQGDISASLSVNLMGAPAMNTDEFRTLLQNPDPILGASIKVTAPTGKYDSDKRVNVGRNRWAAKAEIGYINPLTERWIFELETGIWWYGDNDDHINGTKGQDNILAVESHLVRIIRPGFWTSLDMNYYRGGRTRTNGISGHNKLSSSKVGFTLVFPMDFKEVVKLSFVQGSITEGDNDFYSLLLTYTRRID